MLNRNKPAARRGQVLFIDASSEFGPDVNQNSLRLHDIEHISTVVHSYADVQKYSRVVSLEEIAQNDWNLNIRRYVDTSETEKSIDVVDALKTLRQREQERAAAEAAMNRYLEGTRPGVKV